MKQLGIDIGSTTLKYVLLDEDKTSSYLCKYRAPRRKDRRKIRPKFCCQICGQIIPAKELISSPSPAQQVMGIVGRAWASRLYRRSSPTKIAVQPLLRPKRTSSSNSAARTQRSSFLTGGFEDAHERHLRRRHRRVHRPDGVAHEDHAGLELNDLAAKAQTILHHRLALRRVCKIRHSAASQSGRAA